MPLLKVPKFIGHVSDRVMRRYNEDRIFAGVLEIPVLDDSKPVESKPVESKPVKSAPVEPASPVPVKPASSEIEPSPEKTDPPEKKPATRKVYSFGVFDGHGGTECSQFLSENLATYVEQCDLNIGPDLAKQYAKEVGGYWRGWRSTLLQYTRRLGESKYDDLLLRLPLAFLKADYDFIAKDHLTGSTATSVYIYSVDQSMDFWDIDAVVNLTVAQVGDTRAILGDQQGNALALTSVHHPNNPHESDRLKAFAGAIFHDTQGTSRIMQFANSRAFGDRQGKSRGISAEPQLTSYQIGPNSKMPAKEAFLIMVSDGVTDKASDQELVDLVIQAAQSGGSLRGTPQAAADEVVRYVETLGTEDNATVLVIRLGGWGRWDGWSNRSGKIREQKLRSGSRRQ